MFYSYPIPIIVSPRFYGTCYFGNQGALFYIGFSLLHYLAPQSVSNFFMLCFVVFMQSEGFKYLEENCQSLVSELLETIALVDEKPGSTLSRKRSSSSINGIDLAAEGAVAAAESVNPVVRRMRRRL